MSIGKVQIDIEEFLLETSEPCLDDRTGNEWLKRFRDTLQFKGRKANPLPFGIDCIIEAEGFNAQQAVKRMSGVVKAELVKNGNDRPTSADIEKALNDRYGSEYITYKNAIAAKEAVALRRERIKQKNIADSLGITAGAPTREDGVKPEGVRIAPKAESGTPATISQDASTRKGEDDCKAPTSCTVSSKEPVVLNLAYSGEFGNVTLTQEQYNSLLQKFGNKTACDRAIDSLSAKLENGELKARSHYAVLVKWANYRNDKADERNDDGETYLEKNWRNALNNVGMKL